MATTDDKALAHVRAQMATAIDGRCNCADVGACPLGRARGHRCTVEELQTSLINKQTRAAPAAPLHQVLDVCIATAVLTR